MTYLSIANAKNKNNLNKLRLKLNKISYKNCILGIVLLGSALVQEYCIKYKDLGIFASKH